MSDLPLSNQPSLNNYFKEISEIVLLTPAEEIDLAVRIKKDDQRALKKLVNANLRFVVSVAKNYQNHGLSLEDLINEGNLGLMKAAYRFDETRGFKFISYAVWWIKQSILQAIAEKTRMIRLPLNRVGTLTKIGKVYSHLEQEYERAPTSEEIAEDSDVMDESLKEDVNHILNTLSQREARILRLYYGLAGEKPHTLEEIGVMFKLTRERVRQIKEKALLKLRHSSRSKTLLQYLG